MPKHMENIIFWQSKTLLSISFGTLFHGTTRCPCVGHMCLRIVKAFAVIIINKHKRKINGFAKPNSEPNGKPNILTNIYVLKLF